MSIHRKVRKAPEGKAGFEVEGLPGNTYDEHTAKRLQYMKMDGSDEFDFPASGKLAEVSKKVAVEDDEGEPESRPIANPSGRP